MKNIANIEIVSNLDMFINEGIYVNDGISHSVKKFNLVKISDKDIELYNIFL